MINPEHEPLLASLKSIVGKRYVLTAPAKIQPYCKGFRFGEGEALAVARPATLLQVWQLLQQCVAADVIVIMQAANTGLTGGSTPDGNQYDRPIVIINTMRIDQIQLIDNAKQIIGLAGSTLFGLETVLAPYGREPHSVIGSSCIGASIVGGICNNSGGALVQRGPAYTELSLYAQIAADGTLSLVNHLGIDLGETPEAMLTNLEQQNYRQTDIHYPDKRASDDEYHHRVRQVDEETPARFNNDGRRLHEASGCAGKLAVFAVRLDTYPIAKKQQVFYIGTNDSTVLAKMRRDILSEFDNLPVSGEYLSREYYDVCKKYGKDTFLVIDKLGSKYIPKLFSLKRTVDRIAGNFKFLPAKLSDHLMQYLSYLWPNHLPKKMDAFRERFAHHWILEMNDDGVEEARQYLSTFFASHEGDYFECTPAEGEKAILHRFVAGGAVGRYHTIKRKQFGPMMTVDVALKRNEQQWLEVLPQEIEDKLEAKLYLGHLFCHVMHQNYILKKGVDAKALKQQLLAFFDARGAEYPAEHNVGHEYHAKPALKTFYRKLDPTNGFNPGIGKTSKNKHWSE
ncbi:D-Lactate dehydrogenase [Methylophaga frappieri]|uniref:Quinone-dependent D-lactate dehydrogenase n=1 Tax=Methylophaga frappieri (strain ATCC BAA-2434 / DSM 25690 / JAM7) TaxID=754477 RepID=I1YIL1_METFJ|nr:D-lactate dehydrogenase [Methylophaga frappieri]AFJ02754.1 D-Lactate dehydrogenase [Methylophaga frappieri]